MFLLALALLPSPAHAAPPSVLPGAAMVAGEPGVVELWAPELSPEARVRGRSDLARVGSATAAGDGRWLLPVTPSADATETVTVLMSLKDGEEREEFSLTLAVRPALHGALAFSSPAEGLVLGDKKSVGLRLQPLGSSYQALADRELLVRSTLGRSSAPLADASGWTLTWTAPTALTEPAFALVTVADAAAPTRVVGWTALPIQVPTDLTLPVRAGATCTLEAGPVTTPPTTAAADGSLRLQVDLHPAVSRGTLRCEEGAAGDGQSSAFERAVALPAGQDPWVAWLPLPPRVPAGATLPIQAVVIEDDGRPRTAGSAPLVSGAGVVGELSLVASGLYSGSWTAPESPGKVELRATLHGRSDVVQVEVVPPGSPSSLRPAQVVAWAEPGWLPASEAASGSRSSVVLASALDAVGLPVPRHEFSFEAIDGRVKSRRMIAGSDGRAAVRLDIDDGVRFPGVRVSAGGTDDTALVLISDQAPLGALGSGPVQLREARASLARGEAVVPRLEPAPVSTARAAAGEQVAMQAVEAGASGRAEDDGSARVAVSIGTVPHAWRQRAVEGDKGIPDDVSSDQGDLFGGDPIGPLALDLRALWLPRAFPLGLDLRVSGRQERYRVVGTDFQRLDLQLVGGLRVPVPVSPDLTPYLLVQAEGSRVPLFSYDTFRQDDPTKATGARLIPATVIAGRVGGGVVFGFAAARLELEATESLAPWPVHSRVGVALDYTLMPALAARASIDLGFRHMRFDLESEQVDVDDQQHFMGLGLVWVGG